jgi:hypothetical protein
MAMHNTVAMRLVDNPNTLRLIAAPACAKIAVTSARTAANAASREIIGRQAPELEQGHRRNQNRAQAS